MALEGRERARDRQPARQTETERHRERQREVNGALVTRWWRWGGETERAEEDSRWMGLVTVTTQPHLTSPAC